MKVNLYCIRDSKAKIYGPVLTFRSEVEAVRYFKNMINDPEYKFFYQDLDLYELGTYDQSTGTFDIFPPAVVEHGKELYCV